MTFSIIIPVYNGIEEYLAGCVRSILKQGFQDFEVILVDDCSTDGSAALGARLLIEDGRGLVLRNGEHGGPGAARNLGLRAARGRYVLFVDGDDVLEPGALRAAAEAVKGEPDVAFLYCEKLYPCGRRCPMGNGIRPEALPGDAPALAQRYLSRLPKYPASPCDKAFRRDFLVENGLFFPEGLRCEDLDFTMGALLRARRFSASTEPYYLYRQGRAGSVSREISYPRGLAYVRIMEKWLTGLDSRPEEAQEMIRSFMGFLFPFPLIQLCRVRDGERRYYLGRIRALDRALGRRFRPRDRIIRGLYLCLGPSITGALLRFYLGLRDRRWNRKG